MIRAVIADDEAPARERLRHLLEGRAIEIVGEAGDGNEALERIEALAPELVFLDIQMPGLSGLEVASRLHPPRPRLVFCTAYDEFALAAFEHQAVDYLLKPVNRDRLSATVDRVCREIEGQRQRRQADEAAARTQAWLMPRGGVRVRGLECHGACRPAREVGGDFFDFFPLDGDRIALAVGDISGKGGFAGLLAAALQARMQTLVAAGVHAPGDLVARMNRLTLGTMEDNRFATVFFARYDGSTRVLQYASAGHLPALVVSRSGAVQELPPTATAIGWTHELAPEERTVPLHRDDLLLIYTDGITECTSPAGHEFGAAGLARLASGQPVPGPAEITRRIFDELDEFSAFAAASDDRTLVAAKVL
jgi:sigma-B regulation protein RsbU (phosphoserine phosphatase)